MYTFLHYSALFLYIIYNCSLINYFVSVIPLKYETNLLAFSCNFYIINIDIINKTNNYVIEI